MKSIAAIRILCVLLGIAYCSSAAADNASWRKAMASVQVRMQTYYDFAHSRQDFGAATALNGIDAEKHRCAIVGRMLGFVEEIRDADFLKAPPLTTEVDAYSQLEYAYSLDSWLAQADSALGMSSSE